MGRIVRVIVWGNPHDVTVYRELKTVWYATGEYMGKTLTVKGTSEGAAIKRWREAAKYRGNIGDPL